MVIRSIKNCFCYLSGLEYPATESTGGSGSYDITGETVSSFMYRNKMIV